ncbi:HU family DNA-binding protein [candidate division KSB1 bacterium]|nr:HU family DNA-binding protein [candidate division KSB1 bacterium]
MAQKIKLTQLIDKIADETNLEPSFIRQFIYEYADVIEEGLRRDGQVRIHEFGTFSLHWIKPRQAKNPKTGELHDLAGKYRVNFNPAKSLKEAVNAPYAHLKPLILGPEPVSPEEENTKEEFGLLKSVPTIPEDADTVEDSLAPQSNAAEGKQKEPAEKPTIPSQRIVQQPVRRVHKEQIRHPKTTNTSLVFVSMLFVSLFVLVIYIFLQKYHRIIPFDVEHVARENQHVIGADAAGSMQENIASRNDEYQSAVPVSGRRQIQEYYQVTSGDNLWNLAAQHYRQATLWPYIFNANYPLISNPDSLAPGKRIIIPSGYNARETAAGYFNTYLLYRRRARSDAYYFLQQAMLLDSTIIRARRSEIASVDYQRLEAMRGQIEKSAFYGSKR